MDMDGIIGIWILLYMDMNTIILPKRRFKNKRYMYRNNYNRNKYYNNNNPKYGFIKKVILILKAKGFNQRGQNFQFWKI